MKNVYPYNSPIGKLYIAEENGKITDISFEKIAGNSVNSGIIKSAKTQLDEYFQGKRRVFDLPLEFEGTEFQKRVWNALLTIPYGKTASYKDIAKLIGNEKASRAVGMANNKNKIVIVVPCHRIIGTNGRLVGYAGGLKIKENLLEMEKKNL